jgi:predicted secreted protein
MSLMGSLVIFVILWMIIFFMILPLKIKSQLEQQSITPGTDPGAPSNPQMYRKFIITTVISLFVFAIIYLLSYFEIINLREFFSKL